MELIQTLGAIDIALIIVIVFSVFIGLMRGAVREILSLVALVVSVYLAFSYSAMISDKYVKSFLPSENVSYIVTFVLIIVATLFCITLINLFISQLLKASGLSLINRFLGVIFGSIRACIICTVIVLVVGSVPGVSSQYWWKESTLAPIFTNLSTEVLYKMPKNYRQYFEDAQQSIGNTTKALSGDTPRQLKSNSVENKIPNEEANRPKNIREDDKKQSKNEESKNSVLTLESAN